MPHDPLYTAPHSRYTVFITFEWGAASVARYVRWTSDLTVAGLSYTSAMDLEVTLPKFDGELEDRPAKVAMRATRQPLANMIRPLYMHAPVRVTIAELDPGNTGGTPRVVFAGTIGESYRNWGGAAEVAACDVNGPKALIQYDLGLESTDGCIWVYTDPTTCGVPIGSVQQYATITAVAGTTVAAPALTMPRAHHWTLGWVEVDGLRIGIIDSGAGVSALRLRKHPPPEWLGAAGRFVPRCDRSIGDCRYWNNEPRFMGLGIAQLDYDPTLGSK